MNLEILHFIPSNTFNPNQNIGVFIEGKLCEKETYLSFPSCMENKNVEFEEEIIALQLYPNPTSEAQTRASYQVGLKKGRNQLVVRDLYGRSLIEQKLTSSQGEILIDCSSLAKGVYMVSLQNEKQILKTIKLIVN